MKKTLIALSIMLIASTAESACNTKSMKGIYIASGNYMGYNNGYPVSCGILIKLNFDGNGNSEMQQVETCAGQFSISSTPNKINGIYVMNENCIGGATFNNLSLVFSFDKSLKNGQIIGGDSASGLSGSGTIIKQ